MKTTMTEFNQKIKNDMETFLDKYVKVLYDEKEYEGKVEEIFMPRDKGVPGFILRGHDEQGAEQYKHIKITRIKNIVDREGQGPQGLLKAKIENNEKRFLA